MTCGRSENQSESKGKADPAWILWVDPAWRDPAQPKPWAGHTRGQGTQTHLAVGAGLLENPVEKTDGCLGMPWTRLDGAQDGCPTNVVHHQELRQGVLSLRILCPANSEPNPPCVATPGCAPELRVTVQEWVDFVSSGQVRKTNTEKGLCWLHDSSMRAHIPAPGSSSWGELGSHFLPLPLPCSALLHPNSR